MKTAIDINRLSYSYREYPVLDDISLSVPKGDFFIIIGPNGSGKTTLMKSISGILKPENGNLKIFDTDIRNYSRRTLARLTALVPQEVPVDFPFSVTEFVLMGRSPYLGMLGIPREEDIEIANQSIIFTGIDHLSDRKINQLSGGERQRVFISRAICQKPQIILLDEPTASLDLSHQVKIMDLMEKLKEEKGVTVVMVSHDINLAAMYGDTLLLLKDGKIVCQGTPDNVLTFKTLEKAYGCTLLVDKSPLGNMPRVTPVPGKFISDKGL